MCSLRSVQMEKCGLKGSAVVTCAGVFAAMCLLSLGCARPPAKEETQDAPAVDKSPEVKDSKQGPPPSGPPDIELSTVAWSPDGKLLLAGYRQGVVPPPNSEEGKRVTVWDVETGKRLQELKGHDGSITFVGFLPDSKRAVTAGGSTIKMWDVREGKQLWSSEAYVWFTACAALSPDGKFVLSWGYDDQKAVDSVRILKLVDTTTGKLLREFNQYKDLLIEKLRFMPDSRHAFIDWDPRLLDVTTGETGKYYKKGEDWKYPRAFSPDGKMALSEKRYEGAGADAYLVLWDLASGKMVRRFEDRVNKDVGGPISSCALAFTPDGKRVLSGDGDGKLRIWDAATGKLLSAVDLLDDDPTGLNRQRKGPPEKARVWLFSPDGKMALTSSGRKPAESSQSIMFTLWDVSNGKLLRRFQFEPGRKDSPDYTGFAP